MALKTKAIDRVPTYPGRVTMTPVSGQANTYDMVRADSPVTEGTPINAALFNQKADILGGNTTVYVNKLTGSDVIGDGSTGAPYATIQAAIDSIPKCLGGFSVTVNIAANVYDEIVNVNGFYGGVLVIGVPDVVVIVKGIRVDASNFVRINISEIVTMESTEYNLLHITNNSSVALVGALVVDGLAQPVGGIMVENGSTLIAMQTVSVTGVGYTAVASQGGSTVALQKIVGSDNTNGLKIESGGVITYTEKTITSTNGDITASGSGIGSVVTFRETAVFAANGWAANGEAYTQTISVSGILPTDDPFVDVYLDGINTNTEMDSTLEGWYCIDRMSSADGAIVGYCFGEKPTVDVPIIVKVVR